MELRTQAIAKKAKPSDHWQPQYKQKILLEVCGLTAALNGGEVLPATCERIGYGGAAFGGKTDGLLGVALIACMQIPGVRVGYFRRTFRELEGADGPIDRSMTLFHDIAHYNQAKYRWNFPNGSALHFCHCQYEADVFNYQSQAFDILMLDEATHFSWFIVDYLLTRNRKSRESTLPSPFSIFTTNPGGIGHLWYMQLFDVDKRMGDHLTVKPCNTPNGTTEDSIFIPAFLEDNVIGIERDPEYEKRLMARDPVVARALRFGDWTVFAGQVFREFDRKRHIIQPFEIPGHWPTWRSVDWGYAAPMCCLWWAKDPDSGHMYVIRELYKTGINDPIQARMIVEMTGTEHPNFTFADPSMWTKRTTTEIITSTYDAYLNNGVFLTKADNDHANKKRKTHTALSNMYDGEPYVRIFNNCDHLIQTMPTLVYDPKNPEEILDGQEDHAYDAFSYGLTAWNETGLPKPKKAVEENPWLKIRSI